ncbi:MAG: xanthine dehydrogenase, partial [Halobacteriovoraceae bacterium]|nr:xanthine dehydrogenase [Halobacteriovoraceae bacterium]
GAQCGFCTPGVVCSLASMSEDVKKFKKTITKKKVKNYLTGNLCRCTGYEPIIAAGEHTEIDKVVGFSDRYNHAQMIHKFKSLNNLDVNLVSDTHEVYIPSSYKNLFSQNMIANTQITAGATDLGVMINKGKGTPSKITSLSGIIDAYKILNNESGLIIGARASLTDVEKSCKKDFSEFSYKLKIFASPQIKNKGTLVGNLVNASPVGDTIPFLIVAGAIVIIQNSQRSRRVPVALFFKGGYKQIDLQQDEIVTHIIVPKNQLKFKIYKVSTRKDLDISTVSMAISYILENDKFSKFKITFGGVGPTVMQIKSVENEIIGKALTPQLYKKLAKLIDAEITPLSDLRGTEKYRRTLCHNLFLKFCDEVMAIIDRKKIEVSL